MYKRSGSWDSWYYDYDNLIHSQTIELRCYFEQDNEVTIKGEACFYCFDDYSSLKEYCKAHATYRSFTISNLKEIPSTYSIDSNTTLKYADGIFSIDYFMRYDYSVNFYSTDTSKVTYGTY